MRRGSAATLFFVATVMVAPAAGQEAAKPSVAGAVKARLEGDLGALVPKRQEVPKLLAGVAGVWVLTRLDRGPSRDFADSAPGGLTSLEPLGRFGVGNALGASFLAVGLARGEKNLVSRGVACVEANLLASWLVAGLQNFTGRARPWQAHAGEFGRKGSSFPSAHAAHAFAWAGVLWGSYPEFRARWVFPVLASGVALS
ncbi:MAG: phosphatase PAP2 family protein, partial [Thermoanaerobaculum sp.]